MIQSSHLRKIMLLILKYENLCIAMVLHQLMTGVWNRIDLMLIFSSSLALMFIYVDNKWRTRLGVSQGTLRSKSLVYHSFSSQIFFPLLFFQPSTMILLVYYIYIYISEVLEEGFKIKNKRGWILVNWNSAALFSNWLMLFIWAWLVTFH